MPGLRKVLFVQVTFLALLIVAASTAFSAALVQRVPSDYAPVDASDCPKPLTRKASSGRSAAEQAYVKARKTQADAALRTWLASTKAGFKTSGSGDMPTLALATSGGGFRSMLTGAGVHQALDARERVNSSLAGLYQSMTYEAGLSGGSWLLSSLMGNNWPRVTDLKTSLWYRTIGAGLLDPDQFLALVGYADIGASLAAKEVAGYEPTLIDAYGRLLGYALLKKKEGGVAQTLSSIAQQANYTAHHAPFPLVTAVQAKPLEQGCLLMSDANATQFEFSPVEFGSWDAELAQFLPIDNTGSTAGKCINRYDNLGYIVGTSSDIFTNACSLVVDNDAYKQLQTFINGLEKFLPGTKKPLLRDIYAPYPYSFAQSTSSGQALKKRLNRSNKSSLHSDELYLIDGGYSGQIVPVWPFLHRSDVDVLFVNDNDASTAQNFPNGSTIHNTYLQAQQHGLTRMPAVPTPATFVSKGYSTRPTFFGCHSAHTMTLIYMPNYNYTYASNTSTFQLQYSPAAIDGMTTNGQHVATGAGNNGRTDMATCVGCAILAKSNSADSLPSICTRCFAEYCA